VLYATDHATVGDHAHVVRTTQLKE
jgi:hypothetical protein